MGQSVLPPWLEITGYVFSTISTLIGVLLSIYLIQKAKLENQKTRLETRKLELEVLEQEKKLKSKKKPSKKSVNTSTTQYNNSPISKILVDIQAGENRLTENILMLLSPFKQEGSTELNHQRVFGSIIEWLFYFLFIYADASFAVQNLAVFFPTGLPILFENTTFPLVISSIGTTVILGIMIGDLSGLTSLTYWSNFQQKKKPYLPIMLITLVVNIILSLLIAIYQTNLIVLIPENLHSNAISFGFFGQSLIIAPMLVTTAFLFSAPLGFFTILAGIVSLLRIPITLTRKVVAKIKYYFYD